MVATRPATADDAAGVQRVARATYRTAYTDVVGEDGVETMLSTWYDRESLRDRIADGDARTFVAVEPSDGDGPGTEGDEDRVVGYSSAFVVTDDEDPVGHLGTLYVLPDRWGAGIGSRLFDRARTHLGDTGADRMRIRVFADNDVGLSFYEDRATLVEETTDHVDPLDREVPVAVYEAAVE